jgi:hypothetical protein
MSPAPSYRQRRQTRVRIIAAVLAFCLAAPPLLFALQALNGFGAGITVLLTVAAVAGYLAFAHRQPTDRRD